MRNPSSFVSVLPHLPSRPRLRRIGVLFGVGFFSGILGTFAWASAPDAQEVGRDAVETLLEEARPANREMEYEMDRLELRQGAAIRSTEQAPVRSQDRQPGVSEILEEDRAPAVRGIIGVDGEASDEAAPTVHYE